MKKTIPILILIFCFSCTDVNSLVKEIAKCDSLEGEIIGFTGRQSEQYLNYQKFKSIASDEELNDLTEHESPLVRTYTYLTLIERELIKPSLAFESAMSNNKSFSKMSADLILSSDICTEIYFHVLNNNPDLETEIKQMDSLILFKLEENHFLQYMALKDKKYMDTYNSRIIELALIHYNSSAIFYINNNGIEVDKSRFKKSIQHAIDNNKIGTEPKRKLNLILQNLNLE